MSLLSDWIEKNKDNPDHELAVRNYSMNKDLYERDHAKAVADGTLVICQHCGYPEMPERSCEGKSFVENQCCFSCWYWLHHIGFAKGTPAKSIIVKGVHYQDGGNKPHERNSFLGFSGAKWRYRKIGETEIHVTNNMWHQSTIPNWLKERGVVDTHEFLKEGES